MKLWLIAASMVALAGSAIAEDSTKLPPELVPLKQRYERDLEIAKQQIIGRYVADLQTALRSAALKRDFPAAQAIQDEISSVSPKEIVLGKWKISWPGGSRELTLRSDGSVFASDLRGKKATWEVTDEKLVLAYGDGHTDTLSLPIDPKGMKGKSWAGPEIAAVKVGQ